MQKTSRFYGVGYGMVIIIGLLLICSIFFSTLLRFTSISEHSIQWLLFIMAIIIFTIGGFISGKRVKEKGLLTGLMTAAGVLVIILLFQYLGYDSTASGSQMIFFAAFLASSAVGGAIGVNTNN